MGMVRQFSDAELGDLATRFKAATPFPHVVIDDFLSPEGATALRDYPTLDWPHWTRFFDEYQKEKRFCADIEVMPGPFAAFMNECSRPHFLKAIETITGVTKVLPDPYLDGGGLHCSGPGGVLIPHTDFHLYQRLDLYRMLNLLVYLNEDWGLDDGGELELYRKGDTQPSKSIAPVFGRAVLFKTDDQSVHGFSRPIAQGKQRQSVALYYYNSHESPGYGGDTGTHWQDHGRMTGVRLALFNGLIFASRAFSKAAHSINPNMRRPG
jgi:hypothetical protein